MSYPLTDDQVLLVQSVHEFCESPDIVAAVEADNANPGTFPENSWQKLAEMGLIGLSIPEEYGGQGQSIVTELVAFEALLQHAYPACESLAGHSLGMNVLLYWGSEDIKKKYLIKCATGEYVCCGAATDPSGSFNMSEWGIRYQETDAGIVVNGEKVMVTNADRADVKIVFGRTPEGVEQSIAFIVEKGTSGLETGYQEQRLLPGPQDWGSIKLTNVCIPKENFLKRDEKIMNKWNALGFNQGAMLALSLGQGSFQMAMGYTSQRTNSGRPLNQLQSVAHRLANMAIRNEIARASILTAADLWDKGMIDESVRLSFMNKAWVTEQMAQNTHDATVLHGGVGFTPQAMVGYLNTNAPCAEIAECPPDILRDMVAETYGIDPVWKTGRP